MNIIGNRQSPKAAHLYRREPNFPFWTLCANQKSRLTITHGNGQSFDYNATFFILMEPNTPFVTFCHTAVKNELWIAFTPSLSMFPLLNWPENMPGLRSLRIIKQTLRNDMYEALGHAVDNIISPYKDRETLAMNAIERVLLLAQSAMGSSSFEKIQDQRILQASELIREHPEQKWTIKELAKKVGMSETNFNRRFAEEVGISPIRYADMRKIEYSKALLLQTNASITEIAERLGYTNPYHFSNRFHALSGKSPKAFRKNPAENLKEV